MLRVGSVMRHVVLVVLTVATIGTANITANSNDIESRDVTVGGNVTLSCPISPTLLAHYKWVYVRAGTKRPQVISSGRQLVVGEPRFSIQLKKSGTNLLLQLLLTEVRKYEAGLFMCWRLGERPHPQIYMNVNDQKHPPVPPVITRTSGPSTVQYGDAANFTCFIEPPNVDQVFWLWNNRSLSPVDKTYQQTTTREGAGLRTALLISSVRRSGYFTCRALASHVIDHEFYVSVVVPRVESLESHPTFDQVQYGDEFSLTCTISESKSQVVWLKDGEVMEVSESSQWQRNSQVYPDGKLVSTVFIKEFKKDNNGQYVCYLPGSSRSLLINIEGRPPRLLGISGNEFFIGNSLNLSCCTQYDMHAKSTQVLWKFDGKDLDPTWSSRMDVAYKKHNVTCHHLVLVETTGIHSGVYKCITPFGTASTIIVPVETTPSSTSLDSTPLSVNQDNMTAHPLTGGSTALFNSQTITTSVNHEGKYYVSSVNTTGVVNVISQNTSDTETSSEQNPVASNSSSMHDDRTAATSTTEYTPHKSNRKNTLGNSKHGKFDHYDYYYNYDINYDYPKSDIVEKIWIESATPSPLVVVEGNTAVLNCDIHGSSEYIVMWEKEDSKMLLTAGHMKLARNNRLTLDIKEDKKMLKLKLIISSVRPFDSGTYSCFIFQNDVKIKHFIELSIVGNNTDAEEKSAKNNEILSLPTTQETTDSDVNMDSNEIEEDDNVKYTDGDIGRTATYITYPATNKTDNDLMTSFQTTTLSTLESNATNQLTNPNVIDCDIYEREIEYDVNLYIRIYHSYPERSHKRQNMIQCLEQFNNISNQRHSRNSTYNSTTDGVISQTTEYIDYPQNTFQNLDTFETTEEGSDDVTSAYTTSGPDSTLHVMHKKNKTPDSYDYSPHSKENGIDHYSGDDVTVQHLVTIETQSAKHTDVTHSPNTKLSTRNDEVHTDEDDGSGYFESLSSKLDAPYVYEYTREEEQPPSHDYEYTEYEGKPVKIDEYMWMAHDLLGLPCPAGVSAEEIIWKKDDEILFLGLLDLTGDSGMFVNQDGILHLTGTNTGWYTCYIQHPVTFQEIPVKSYYIVLKGSTGEQYLEIMEQKKYNFENLDETIGVEQLYSDSASGNKSQQDSAKINGTKVTVVATSLQVGDLLKQILTFQFGFQTNEAELCKIKSEITSFETAYDAIKTCEAPLLAANKGEVGVLVTAVNFKINLLPGGWYSSTLIYAHDCKTNVTAHSHTPLIPDRKNYLSILDRESYKSTLESSLKPLHLSIK